MSDDKLIETPFTTEINGISVHVMMTGAEYEAVRQAIKYVPLWRADVYDDIYNEVSAWYADKSLRGRLRRFLYRVRYSIRRRITGEY